MKALFVEAKNLFREEQLKGTFTHYSFSGGSLKQKQEAFFCGNTEKENLFDLASLTKALATTPLLLKEFTEKTLKEDDSLAGWLGQEASCFRKEIQRMKVISLLGHTSGLPPWYNFWTKCDNSSLPPWREEELVKRVNASFERGGAPGGFVYSDVGFILLGLCLKIKHKKSLDELFKAYWKERKFQEELFYPGLVSSVSAVSTGFCAVRKKLLKGEVHDENCASFAGVSGHAGLFGTRAGVESFLKFFWNTKEFQKMFELSQTRNMDCGWRRRKLLGEEAFGHLGFTGCALWVFPKKSSYLLLLTNRVVSGRLSPVFAAFREKALMLGRQLLDEKKY